MKWKNEPTVAGWYFTEGAGALKGEREVRVELITKEDMGDGPEFIFMKSGRHPTTCKEWKLRYCGPIWEPAKMKQFGSLLKSIDLSEGKAADRQQREHNRKQIGLVRRLMRK